MENAQLSPQLKHLAIGLGLDWSKDVDMQLKVELKKAREMNDAARVNRILVRKNAWISAVKDYMSKNL